MAVLLAAMGCRARWIESPTVLRETAEISELRDRAVQLLGDREGTVLMMDSRTGRLLIVINPRLATQQAFPPGSTIKPLTALAALQLGRMDRLETHRCEGGYRAEGRNLLCTHGRFSGPLTLTEALAHSCNDYFGKVGGRLGEGAALRFFEGWGFGRPTGWGGSESLGRLPRGDWRRESALGADESFLVTPLQLLQAYQGLANGGRICRPSESVVACEVSQRVVLPPSHRDSVLEGLRAAVEEGTARAAHPDLPLSLGEKAVLYGKTGTSAASNRFRTQGWFVGLVATPSVKEVGVDSVIGRSGESPAAFRWALLVMLKRASGAEAAALARPLLATLMGAVPRSKIREPAPVAEVRLRLNRGRGIQRLSLERYLVGVLRGEVGEEREREALKAQAVVSRTFALAHLGRHATEGFDFCGTTHCQAYQEARESGSAAEARLDGAVKATRGEVLTMAEPGGRARRLPEVYFHAACGGKTTGPHIVWGGGPSPPHLRGVEDPYCEPPSARPWEDRLSLEALDRALRADPRTNPRGSLRRLRVVKRDSTGRVAWIEVESTAGHKPVRGWDLRLAIGRALGWQYVKSTWFDLEKEGSAYRFRGRGFGHGLGLCQRGAHQQARRGRSYPQILSHYFPGSSLGEGGEGDLLTSDQVGGGSAVAVVRSVAAFAPLPRTDRRRFRTEGVEWEVPRRIDPRQVERVRTLLERAILDLRNRLVSASLDWPPGRPIELHLHATTAEFIDQTGLPGWMSGAATRHRIDLQPISLLEQRGELVTTLRHELTHLLIERLAPDPPPRWLAEGMALYVAGEGRRLLTNRSRPASRLLPLDQLEARLARPISSPSEMRLLYTASYQRLVTSLELYGEAALWRRLARQLTLHGGECITPDDTTPFALRACRSISFWCCRRSKVESQLVDHCRRVHRWHQERSNDREFDHRLLCQGGVESIRNETTRDATGRAGLLDPMAGWGKRMLQGRTDGIGYSHL